MTRTRAAIAVLAALAALPLAGCSGEQSIADQARSIARAAEVEQVREVLLGNGTLSLVYERDGAFFEGYAANGDLAEAPLDLAPTAASASLDELDVDAWSDAVAEQAAICPDAEMGRLFRAPTGAVVVESGCLGADGIATVRTRIDGAERAGAAGMATAEAIDGALEDARLVLGEELADFQSAGDAIGMSARITGAPTADGCLPSLVRTAREGSVEFAGEACLPPDGAAPRTFSIAPDAVDGARVMAAVEAAGAEPDMISEIDLGLDEAGAFGVRWAAADGTSGFERL